MYCGYEYKGINDYLRTERDEEHKYKLLSTFLGLVLCSTSRIPCNLVVYRAVSDEFINELISHNKNNSNIQKKGFLSTTLLKSVVMEKDGEYENYSNILKIYVKKGSIGIYVNEIAKRGEEEILLLNNGFLELCKYPYKENNKMIYEFNLIEK